jgi:hypothetical protein
MKNLISFLLVLPVVLAQSTVPSYTKNALATKRIEMAYGDFAVWIDDTKWKQTEQSATTERASLEFVKGSTTVRVWSEPKGMLTDPMLEWVLTQYRNNGHVNVITLISRQQRTVNGKHILAAQFSITRETYTTEHYFAYCYLYGGTSGSIQLIGTAPESVFAHEVNDIVEFLNGVEISDQELPSPDRTKNVSGAKKPKPPKPPSQPSITEGCVTVFDIYSHKLGIFSGITSPEPGVEAKIRNECNVPVDVSVSVGYFDSAGTQFGDGIENVTVGASAVYSFYHEAGLYGLDQARLKTAKIISVRAYPKR